MPEPDSPRSDERLLAFDFGTRQIGVAVGNRISGVASPLAVVAARDGKPAWPQLDPLLREWRPDRLLVGLPLNMDGSNSPMSAAARRFRGRLQARYHLPCELVDERLTSFEARDRLGAGASKADVDCGAACLILESWLRDAGGGDAAET